MAQTISISDIGKRFIPFNEVSKLIEVMPYASKERVAIIWLAETGARPCEIENRSLKEIHSDGFWIWKTRKTQSAIRYEKLSPKFWKEFKEYLQNNKISNNNVFAMKVGTLRRMINMKYRKMLGGDWLKKVPVLGDRTICRMCYRYQLMYLRHNFQTYKFRKYQSEYGKDQALHLVCRDMKHSSRSITGFHYIESLKGLGLSDFANRELSELINTCDQKKITQFF